MIFLHIKYDEKLIHLLMKKVLLVLKLKLKIMIKSLYLNYRIKEKLTMKF